MILTTHQSYIVGVSAHPIRFAAKALEWTYIRTPCVSDCPALPCACKTTTSISNVRILFQWLARIHRLAAHNSYLNLGNFKTAIDQVDFSEDSKVKEPICKKNFSIPEHWTFWNWALQEGGTFFNEHWIQLGMANLDIQVSWNYYYWTQKQFSL